MTRDTLTLWLGLLLGVGSDLAFWLVFLCGGGLILLAGLLRVTSPAWLSVALVAIGAVAGALALVWTVIVPILALVLIVLVVLRARTPATA